jgi:hypothetical protein
VTDIVYLDICCFKHPFDNSRARTNREQLAVQVVRPDGLPLVAEGDENGVFHRQCRYYEIRMEGWMALTDRLGPAGAMRFIMQYDPGYGELLEGQARPPR